GLLDNISPARERRRPYLGFQDCRFGLTRRTDAILEASGRKRRRRAPKQVRRRALGWVLRLGARLSLGRGLWHLRVSFTLRPLGGRGAGRRHGRMFRLGCRGLGLRRGWLDRCLVVRHRGLILALRSKQIAYEASDAGCVFR